MKFRNKITASICLALSLSPAAVNAQENDIDIPIQTNFGKKPMNATPMSSESYQGVNELRNAVSQPDNVMTSNTAPMPAHKRQPDFLQKVKESFKPEQSYTLTPGRNIVIPVGQGFSNAIRTSFRSLSVKTSASAEQAILEIEDGHLYATLTSMQPISLLLSEDGVLESEISIVLVPLSAPPAMVDINIDMPEKMKVKAQKHYEEIEKQKKMEKALADAKNQPSRRNSSYQNNIVSILKPIAQGKTPMGYSITNDIPNHLTHPCRIAIYHEAGQRLSSSRNVIDVVLVHNDSDRVYQVREEMCINDGVTSVALYPKSYLQPGEETEVYIIRKIKQASEKAYGETRPRLTLGAGDE
ncbi:hypothetical protein [Pseudoalteromonas sp. SK20]|uniref:hypothetical protein n=1 Tax=Pseudoalteromonas sp. SK20 TaxID=1938367 RepID=UPI000977B0A1|nr:hypothetical protein [Pseudoalteromonas sp. SK20]